MDDDTALGVMEDLAIPVVHRRPVGLGLFRDGYSTAVHSMGFSALTSSCFKLCEDAVNYTVSISSTSTAVSSADNLKYGTNSILPGSSRNLTRTRGSWGKHSADAICGNGKKPVVSVEGTAQAS